MRLRMILLATALAAACGGTDGAATRDARPEAAGGASGGNAGRAAPDAAEVARLAPAGAQLFQTKTCVGCHTIGGGRQSGPDLAGVTERRDYGWVVSMITHPDSMTANDAVARGLLAEYLVQMPTLGITEEEARALWAYLEQSGGG